MRKLLLTTLLVTNLQVQANEDINYNFLEVGYGYLDIADGVHADGFYLDGAFELSERFYLGAFTDHRDIRNFDFDRYGLSLGFHSNGSNTTDFYTEFKVGRWDVGVNDSTTLGLYVGTRSAFTEQFELITKLGLNHIDELNDNIYEAEIKGLFKLTDQHGITAGLESFDGDMGARVGYRFSF